MLSVGVCHCFCHCHCVVVCFVCSVLFELELEDGKDELLTFK